MSRFSRTHQRRPSGYPYKAGGKPDFWIKEKWFIQQTSEDKPIVSGDSLTYTSGYRYHVMFGKRELAYFNTKELAKKYMDWCFSIPNFNYYWYGQAPRE